MVSRFLCVIIFLIFNVLYLFGNSPDTDSTKSITSHIIQETIVKHNKIESLELTLLIKERFNTKFTIEKADIKLLYHPWKIYMKQEYPNKGLEVLYIEGENNNKAIVNPRVFPWKTLKLDPMGNLMYKGHHHSLFKSGMAFFIDVAEYLWTKYQKKIDEMTTYQGLVKYDNRLCYKIEFYNPDFGFTEYTVGENETIETIVNNYRISSYLIETNNTHINKYETIKPKTVIKVPSDYAKRIVIYIEKSLMLPAGLKAYDETGLFEEYTYSNIRINPSFTQSDFDPQNPAYGF